MSVFRYHGRVRALAIAVIAGASALISQPALSETLEAALVQAYQNNPQINAQRAAVRVVDENVPTALSGYRPRVSATASVGQLYQDVQTRNTSAASTSPFANLNGNYITGGYGLTATQTLYNGFQTANRTRQAESQVFAARETLRSTEQTILLQAATAYMNLLRDTAIFDLQKRNVEVLGEQLRQVRDRFNVGEVTRTDVAQSESRIAAGRSQVLLAEANYKSSAATYRQVIGRDPGRLIAGSPVDRFSPNTLASAVNAGSNEHPNITNAQYNVEAALSAVKVAEGALLPTVSLQGSAQQSYNTTLTARDTFTGTVVGAVTVPIYQGGSEYAAVRQAKETLGQRRIDLDTARDGVRQLVVQSWGQLEAAKANIEATGAQVQATEVALNGVREEARVGQRTTLDVLNAQQELVNARVSMVSAQRDRVVASYTLLASVGRLTPQTLGLSVASYDARVHYHQVRDSWIGLRTPDGR